MIYTTPRTISSRRRQNRWRFLPLLLLLLPGIPAGTALALTAAEQALVERALDFLPASGARRLPFERVDNFRDLGGYPNAQGTHRLRSGLLYRSARLSRIKDPDRELLRELGIRRVSDFRSEPEHNRRVLRLPDGMRIKRYPVVSFTEEELRKTLKQSSRKFPFDGEKFMEDLYRRLVREFTPQYGAWLRSLREEASAPQVIQGVGGKDRIGLASALLLRTLDVHPDIVQGDYLLSGAYSWHGKKKRMRQIRWYAALRPGLEAQKVYPLLTVQQSFLQAAYDEIDLRYGSFQNYLRQGLGISAREQRELQRLYLEPLPGGPVKTLRTGAARSSE